MTAANVFSTAQADLAFNVQLSAKDFAAFQFWHDRRIVAVFAAVGSVTFLWLLLEALFDGVIEVLLIPAVLACFALPAYLWWGSMQMSREPLNSSPWTLECGPSGFTVRSLRGAQSFSWQELHRAVETSNYVFLYLTRRQAVIVPKAAVGGEKQVALLCRRSGAKEAGFL